MKRIVTSDVTQALVQSMEDAGEFKHVLVLSYGKGESANDEGRNSSFYCTTIWIWRLRSSCSKK